MQDLAIEFFKNPTLFTFLLFLVIVLSFAFWQVIVKRLNLNNQSYDDVINERAKELVNKLSDRVDTLEKQTVNYLVTIDELKERVKAEKEENLRLAMLNALIISSKMVIKGLPCWVFSYPDHKAIYVSEEYKIFLKDGLSVADYVNEYNSKIWNSESAKVYNNNNEIAARLGYWIGYEPIIKDDIDLTYDFIVVKLGIKDGNGKVYKTFGMALQVNEEVKYYLKKFVENTKFKI